MAWGAAPPGSAVSGREKKRQFAERVQNEAAFLAPQLPKSPINVGETLW